MIYHPVIGQPDALRVSKLDRKVFENAIYRGDYPALPKGKPRLFAADDLICLMVWEQLMAVMGVPPAMAAHVASKLKAVLDAHPVLDAAYLVRVRLENGKEGPDVVAQLAPGQDAFHTFNVAKYRAQAAEDIRRTWEDQ